MLRAAEVRLLQGHWARKLGDLQELEKARNEGAQLCLHLDFSSSWGYFWAINVNSELWLGAGSWVWGGRVARSPVPRDRQDSAGKQGLL